MFFDVDKVLMAAKPDIGAFLPHELILGIPYDDLTYEQQQGGLARAIGGLIHLEHATECYLLKQVLQRRKVSPDKTEYAIEALCDLQDLEADLIPASKGSHIANVILSWMEATTQAYDIPYNEERMRNLEAVSELLRITEKNQ